VTNGAIPKKPKKPIPTIDQTNDPSILDNACPANILANKRIDKLRTRTLYEINSKIIKNHDIAKGEPDGKKIPANFEFCTTKAITFKPQNDCIPKYRVVNAKLVNVRL